jgi:hypothetical protein
VLSQEHARVILIQGVQGESNPPLRRSQRRVRYLYTLNTMLERLDQDSNPERLVRSEE